MNCQWNKHQETKDADMFKKEVEKRPMNGQWVKHQETKGADMLRGMLKYGL